jgi:LCP family protein required for cell wall assembly
MPVVQDRDPERRADPPAYRRYRAGGPLPRRSPVPPRPPLPPRPPRPQHPPGGARPLGDASGRAPRDGKGRLLLEDERRRWRLRGRPWRGWFRGPLTPKRIALWLAGAVAAWVALCVVLFLVSSHFDRIAPPSSVHAALDPGGFMFTSPENILVLGSDRRPHGSKEPHANTSGPSRSDVMMLLRVGGGKSARLSIPRDTIVEIPGQGLQKINAAYAFGGPALSIEVVKHFLGISVNHVVEVNFENFPALIDAMGGVDYTGPCVLSYLDGGSARGGFTLRLAAGTHHLDGREALALARTRENQCGAQPAYPDLARIRRQQALFSAMKSRLLSISSFLRAPLIAWSAPPAIISDLSGPELLALFAALAVGGTPPTHLLEPTGVQTLPDGEEGLVVSEADRRAAVARFLRE